MRKYVCIILMLALAIAMGASSYATDYPPIRLSELSAEECIEFVKNAGITIPDKFEDEMTWAPFIHDIIVQVEENASVEFYFNYSVLHFFCI